jgi:nitrogen regulatory protein P-II 1
MKRGVAIIKPFILEEVRGVLREVGVPGMTITEVMGFGHQRGRTSVLVE